MNLIAVICFFVGCIPACFLECYLLNHSKEKFSKGLSVLIMCLSILIICLFIFKADISRYLYCITGFLFPIFLAAFLNVIFKKR